MKEPVMWGGNGGYCWVGIASFALIKDKQKAILKW